MGLNNSVIFLVGMPGSGKTTAGKKLAAKLGYDWVDLDAEIEKSAGLSIPDIFKQQGEKAFRVMESESLKSMPKERAVISTGGGAPCFQKNMDWMLAHGKVVYLEMPVKAIHQRILSKTNDRPMFKGKSEEAQLTLLENLLQERSSFYTKSHITISGLSLDINALVEKLN